MSYGQPPGWGPPQGGAYGPPPPPQQPAYPPAPMMHAYPAPNVWTCPYCRFVGQPLTVEKISTGGWIVFVLLLLACFPLCFLGTLMKDKSSKCPGCGTHIGKF